MASSDTQEVAHEFRFFKAFKDGHIEFTFPVNKQTVPAGDDPFTGVQSKDVQISDDPPVSARIFLPKLSNPNEKFRLLFYIHGGGFSMMSAFSPQYHTFCSTVAAEARAVVVSVEYGLFPDRPIPACYEDSWAALQWVAAHATGSGPDAWLNNYADLQRVYIGGDSAGGNITHTMVFRVGTVGLPGVRVVGAILVHPYFGGTVDDHMWLYMHPGNGGMEDPRLKPSAEDVRKIGCEKVLMFVAEKDHLNSVGKWYYEELKKSGWGGELEIVENLGKEHCFHLHHDCTCEEAKEVVDKFVSFVKQE